MTRSAVQGRVGTCERKARQAVIKLRALPRVHRGVALLAGGRKAERPMIGGLGIHVTADMASDAIGRQTFKAPHRCVFVTRIALDQGVRA